MSKTPQPMVHVRYTLTLHKECYLVNVLTNDPLLSKQYCNVQFQKIAIILWNHWKSRGVMGFMNMLNLVFSEGLGQGGFKPTDLPWGVQIFSKTTQCELRIFIYLLLIFLTPVCNPFPLISVSPLKIFFFSSNYCSLKSNIWLYVVCFSFLNMGSH